LYWASGGGLASRYNLYGSIVSIQPSELAAVNRWSYFGHTLEVEHVPKGLWLWSLNRLENQSTKANGG
jgi:hypothetical protein